VSNLWIDVLLPSGTTQALSGTGKYINWTNNTGHALVKQCEVEIGGQLIDRHYSQWLDIWNELTDHDEQEWFGLNKHAAKNVYLTENKDISPLWKNRLYVPLKFWFCRNPGLALPLIALQYHEVKINLVTRNLDYLINSDSAETPQEWNSTPTVDLWADYIYLDTDERRRFAQVSHEYLIEQVQRVTNTMSNSIELNINHPVKELIWVVQSTQVVIETTGDKADASKNVPGTLSNGNDYFCYMGGDGAPTEYVNNVESYEGFGKFKLQLNGHDRFAPRNASYFRTCQPIQAGHKVPGKHIYCYSFALKPEEHQPSGTCNFSRIDNAVMKFEGEHATGTLTVYAVNYNVLRIMSGMGGLAYSN